LGKALPNATTLKVKPPRRYARAVAPAKARRDRLAPPHDHLVDHLVDHLGDHLVDHLVDHPSSTTPHVRRSGGPLGEMSVNKSSRAELLAVTGAWLTVSTPVCRSSRRGRST